MDNAGSGVVKISRGPWQNKENISNTREFIVLQTQLAFFLGSWSKKAILDSCFLSQLQCQVKKTKQYQITCKSLWKLVYWQSFYQNVRPAIIGENKENATEVWGLEKMEKVIKTLWHDYFTLCKSAKVANFGIDKSFSPHNRKCD